MANIQWDRDTKWVTENLIHQARVLKQDEHTTLERTGLHEREFIDTFRITTDRTADMPRNGSVHVLNLVDGERALLTSPDGAFAPMELHYGETCILPQAAGDCRIEAPDGAPVKVIAACVRG